ncbi:MAG: DUF4384 domain-containing protein [Nitrospinae bacterium]|nr:DUF4384 domain-containing protein [Nitrospinota bacterium]
MKRIFVLLFFSLLLVPMLCVGTSHAAQSNITEAEGTACMGEDKTKKQTAEAAFADAKRRAVEYTLTYVKSETQVKNFQLEKDLIEAYGNASVRIIEEMEKKWYRDESMGDCFKIKIKAEVIPDEKGMDRIANDRQTADDPSAPLNVRVWTDKKEYNNGENIKVYLKGNKPFYARVIYKDAGGSMVQILPNLHRINNYFNGAVIYEIPGGEDKFELEVSPPFGNESIIVFGSSSQLGDVDLTPAGELYEINTKSEDIGIKSRGVKIKGVEKDSGQKSEFEKKPAEFSETNAVVKTIK